MAEYSIRDVARLAGVSVGTVSRILNNADNVDEEIRERTMAVIRRVNYRTGPRGRRSERAVAAPLRSLNIALVSPGMGSAWKSNELWLSYMTGIETACRERRARLSMYMADDRSDDIVGDIARNADGILIKMSADLPGYVKELIAILPAVGFGAIQTADPLPQIVVDNHAGGVAAVTGLRKLGHHRIAFINHMANDPIFIARANGYQETMKAAGEFRPEYLREFASSAQAGYHDPEAAPPDLSAQLDALLALPETPTAVILANDWAACGFLQACAARGVRVPEGLSVCGMDDSGNLCNLLRPALSTISMPFNRVSHFAACTLCDLIGGVGIHQRNTASVMRLPGEFKLRESVLPIKQL